MRKHFFSSLALLMISIVFLLPILFTWTGSLADIPYAQSAYGRELVIIPERISVNQYLSLYFQSDFTEIFSQSLIRCLITAFGNTALSLLAAYVLVRIPFRGRKICYFFILLGMMMPFQVTLLPNYLTIRTVGLYDTWWALVLPNLFLPFGVYLLHQFILQIDDDLYAAFRLDSNSTLKMIWSIVIPQTLPAIVTLLILDFAQLWNMVDQPLAMVNNPKLYPLSIAINETFGGKSGLLFAACTVFMIPVLVLYLFFQDEIMEGIEIL